MLESKEYAARNALSIGFQASTSESHTIYQVGGPKIQPGGRLLLKGLGKAFLSSRADELLAAVQNQGLCGIRTVERAYGPNVGAADYGNASELAVAVGKPGAGA